MDKKLIEKRNMLLEEAESILNKSEEEARAMSEKELSRHNEILDEIKAIDKTLEARAASAELEPAKPAAAPAQEDGEEAEIREFAQIIRTAKTETRADGDNFTYGDNGSIIPQTIAKRIIKAIEDRCPIFAGATHFNVKGTLKIPVYGATSNDDSITVGYTSDFTELEAHAGAFTSIDLTGYLMGALTLIGKTLLNSSDIDLASFVINEMADKFAGFIEKELLIGTENKCTGILSCANTLSTAAASAITTDELITLQAKIKQAFQGGAVWTMHPDTFTLIKQLKDGNGRYLIQDDITQGFPYRLLGKPVYVSDNMPVIEAGAKSVLYGSYSGLAINVRENLGIEVLREKYATQHAIGIYGYLEMDSKIMDNKKIAVLKMKEV